MISLSKIAENLESKFPNMQDVARSARRMFAQFVQNGGGNVSQLKNDSGNMMFDDLQKVYVEAILIQLLEKKGKAYDFYRKKPHLPSTQETHDMIEDVLESIDDSKSSEEIIQDGINFLDMLFELTYRQKINDCHMIIDTLQANLEQYPYTLKLRSIERLITFLYAENIRASTEAAIQSCDLIKLFGNLTTLYSTNDIGDIYGEPGDPIRREYEQRDAKMIESLKEDPELRAYVEKKTGYKIEEVFKKYFKYSI